MRKQKIFLLYRNFGPWSEGMSSTHPPNLHNFLNRSASFNAPKWRPLKIRTCLRSGGHEINMPVSTAAPWKHDVFRAIKLGSVRGNWLAPPSKNFRGCALWDAFDFHSGSFVTSHIRAKGLEKHSFSSANISLRHQLLPLHLTDCKPDVWSLRESVSSGRTNRDRNVCALQTRELFSDLNI